MSYANIRNEHRENVNALLEKNQVFFAFSSEQLEAGKAKIGIKENKDLIDIGAGGFLPKANADKFSADMEAETKRYKQALRTAKESKDEAILYELNNHEAFYTGRIDEVVEKFAGIYTREDIQKVYAKNINKKYQCQTCGQEHESQKEAFQCCHNETKKAEAEEEEQEREESRGQ